MVSGKRLWPLSNDFRSKQFLKVIKNEDGKYESMLQRVFHQLKKIHGDIDISIITNRGQVEAINNQLGNDISIIVEPERRNTYPAILLAVSYLKYVKKCDLDETVIIMPVDPYVDDDYFSKFTDLDNIIQKDESKFALLGVTPTYPSDKYGYIIPYEASDKKIIKEFKEKPDVENAKRYIQNGGLWNCGVFAFKLSRGLDIISSKYHVGSYEELLEGYSKLEKTSFDYEVMEKCSSISYIQYDGKWKDLGTWDTLTEVMNENVLGDATMSDDCIGSYVLNELEIPVVTIGIKNVVVAASYDGIIVSDIEKSSAIKSFVDKQEKRPMYEELKWGEYAVLNISNNKEAETIVKKIKIKEGRTFESILNKNYILVLTVMCGHAELSVNGKKCDIYVGDTYTIDINTAFSIYAVNECELAQLEVRRK